MELQEAILKRRSVRTYTNASVAKETVNALLSAAAHAPSAMNSQPWAFAVLQGQTVLKDISDRSKQYLVMGLTEDSPFFQYHDILTDPDFDVFYGAGTLILILAKPNQVRAMEDCQLAAENLMLAACAEGLGTCFIGFSTIYLNAPGGKREYGIPENYTVAAAIVVGEPAEITSAPEKKPLEVLFWKE
jgi:nitroreductase